jgi:hypothetical protein
MSWNVIKGIKYILGDMVLETERCYSNKSIKKCKQHEYIHKKRCPMNMKQTLAELKKN